MDVHSVLLTSGGVFDVLLYEMDRSDDTSLVASCNYYSGRKIIMDIPVEIQNLLKSMRSLRDSEDWNESRAQELIIDGALLYERFVLGNPF